MECIMVKPASGLCNMRCGYCFYADEMNHRQQASYGIMDQETVESVIRKVLAREGSLPWPGWTFPGTGCRQKKNTM